MNLNESHVANAKLHIQFTTSLLPDKDKSMPAMLL